MNKLFIILFICATGLLTGCITPWTISRGGALPNQGSYGVQMNIPAEWYKRRVHNVTLMTRNGLSLESIIIYRTKWTDSLSNGHPIPKSILLHELPELLLGEYTADGDAFNFTMIENLITDVDNLPCARAQYRYTSPNSLNVRGIIYCIPFYSYVTVVCFEAEESHYYAKSVNDFHEMAGSMMIRKKQYRPLPGVKVSKE